MSTIAGNSLFEIINKGYLNALPKNVNAASIDIRIGDEILVEAIPEIEDTPSFIDIDAKESPAFTKIKIGPEGYIIPPGQFILGHSIEEFNLPDTISAQFILRSTMARCGLNHLMAGWADAGFCGAQLTFEFKNENQYHGLLIKPGMRVGQMIFVQHEDVGDQSYSLKGNYNGQKSATEAFAQEGGSLS
jgi:dCTP deaminase